MTTQLLTILQKNLTPLGITQSVIEKIVAEAESASSAANCVKLREFIINYVGEDGTARTQPIQAVNDVYAWKAFRLAHPGLEPTKILDAE